MCVWTNIAADTSFNVQLQQGLRVRGKILWNKMRKRKTPTKEKRLMATENLLEKGNKL